MTKAAARAQSVEEQDHKYDRHPSYSATWAGRREDRVHQWPSEMSEWGEGSRAPSGVGDRKSSTVEMGHQVVPLEPDRPELHPIWGPSRSIREKLGLVNTGSQRHRPLPTSFTLIALTFPFKKKKKPNVFNYSNLAGDLTLSLVLV